MSMNSSSAVAAAFGEDAPVAAPAVQGGDAVISPSSFRAWVVEQQGADVAMQPQPHTRYSFEQDFRTGIVTMFGCVLVRALTFFRMHESDGTKTLIIRV